MKTNSLIAWIGTLAASAAVAGSAQAVMIAGWDFSQYAGEGLLAVDGSFANVDTLPANFSNLDPTFGAGYQGAGGVPPGSDAFGSMFLNGQHGSTDMDENGFPPALSPLAGSLASNLNAGVPASLQFDDHSTLLFEGQPFANFLRMNATQALQAVFSADLGSAPFVGSDWSISFGGQTTGGTADVGIEFSTDGVGYTSFGSVTLNANDTLFSVVLDTLSSGIAYVRLSFGPGGNATIDNVAINATLTPTSVPEAGTAVLLFSGLAGLAWASRRRV